MSLDELVSLIHTTHQSVGRPLGVGVSGYGGSGKYTLARELVRLIPDSVRMRGDDVLDPVRSHERSNDWDGVERDRLMSEVLEPFREQRPAMFRRYDWGIRALGAPESVPSGDIMIVDLIGLFCPETDDVLDLKIWCDVDLETATARGLARDAALGRDHVDLWHNVWVPNERDFENRFHPRQAADVRWVS